LARRPSARPADGRVADPPEPDDAVRDGLDVLMPEAHERGGRATRGEEIVLADEKPRMIEILR
jgi:hypothetical protein